jgi:hypothetical protein
MEIMKSTLPFFAFVSFNIVPYENRSARDYNGLEYLPDNYKTQKESITNNNEEPLIESVKFNKDQA